MRLILCAPLALRLAVPSPAQTRPNILLILADDLGYHDVSFNGRRAWKTPNIDRLARQGTVFRRWYTVAAGLRVPRAIADFVMLDLIRATGGTAVAVSDSELMSDAYALSAATGVCAAPEGGACLSALRTLLSVGWIKPHEKVVLFNTGSGVKYAEAFAAHRFGQAA